MQVVAQMQQNVWSDVMQGVMPAVRELYVEGDLGELLARPRVAIVGSRRITTYGKAVTAQLACDLAEQGIVIVSGLAYGVDAVAHRSALDAGGLTMAVLPSSLESIYPAAHRNLAREIIAKGGALVSEYSGAGPAYKNQFIERNRIVSGISSALLITEAAINSGTMHTARFALEQGKDVLVVPGNITSPNSEGTNNLLKSGAIPVTGSADVLHVLGLKPASKQKPQGATPQEQTLLNLLGAGPREGNQLHMESGLEIGQYNQALVMLEITGKIHTIGNNTWAVS